MTARITPTRTCPAAPSHSTTSGIFGSTTRPDPKYPLSRPCTSTQASLSLALYDVALVDSRVVALPMSPSPRAFLFIQRDSAASTSRRLRSEERTDMGGIGLSSSTGLGVDAVTHALCLNRLPQDHAHEPFIKHALESARPALLAELNDDRLHADPSPSSRTRLVHRVAEIHSTSRRRCSYPPRRANAAAHCEEHSNAAPILSACSRGLNGHTWPL
ncbi:hypothetical protein AURDEDRAFT_188809, partial [Auricularia subglabra TFB-10046 SS5]